MPVHHHHMRPRTMTMRLLVSTHLKLGDVGLHGVVGQLEFNSRIRLAALCALEQTERPRVWDVGAFPGIDPPFLLTLGRVGIFVMEMFGTGPKSIGIAVIAVAEYIFIVEDKIGVVEEIDHYRRVADGQQPDRRGPAVAVLAPGIQRGAGDSARRPVYCLAGPA